MKTVILQNCAKEHTHIFDFLCQTSKNIKNICLFTHTFYEKYKSTIYKDVFTYVNNNIGTINDYDKVNDFILNSLKTQFNIYTENYKMLKQNDNIIYNYVKSYLELSKVQLNNENFYDHKIKISNVLKENKNLTIPGELENIYFDLILDSKLEYIYNKEYFLIKNQIDNNIPISSKNEKLIESVMASNYLFTNKKLYKENYKQWTNELLYFKLNLEENKKSLCKLNYLEQSIEDLKVTDLELFKYCAKLKTKKEFTVYDTGLIEILFVALKRTITKIKINNSFDLSLFEKIYTKILKIDINDIANIKKLHVLCNSVLQLIKSIKIETIKLKLEHEKEICLLNSNDLFCHINEIRFKLVENNLDIEKELLKLSIYVPSLKCNINKLIDNLHIKETKYDVYELLEKIIKNLNLSKDVNKLTSDQTLVQILTRENINSSSNNKIPSDVINNIMNKVQQSITSFYEKKKKDKKCNYPKYLPKNEINNVHWLNKYAMQNKGDYIELFIGDHINENLNEYKNEYHVLLQEGKHNSKYINYNDLKKHKNNTDKKNSFKCQTSFGTTYVPKNSKYIIDGGYIRINIPKINKKIEEITQLEIVPYAKGIYNIHLTYKLKEKYEEPKEVKKSNEGVSVDLGIQNLLTIYDPVGKQQIIKGGCVVATNEYYNKKISKIQNELSVHKKEKSKRLTNAYRKRENVINHMFNQITKWIFERYENKKFIVIGYNIGWKQSPKLGRETRRKFCQIPYKKLINKIFEKGKEKGIEIKEMNEAYTSKCDALMGEKVCKQKEYLGIRTNRGLFVSGNGKAINADINGAINIMRKYCEHKKIQYDGQINGNVYNPEIVKINGYNK